MTKKMQRRHSGTEYAFYNVEVNNGIPTATEERIFVPIRDTEKDTKKNKALKAAFTAVHHPFNPVKTLKKCQLRTMLDETWFQHSTVEKEWYEDDDGNITDENGNIIVKRENRTDDTADTTDTEEEGEG